MPIETTQPNQTLSSEINRANLLSEQMTKSLVALIEKLGGLVIPNKPLVNGVLRNSTDKLPTTVGYIASANDAQESNILCLNQLIDSLAI